MEVSGEWNDIHDNHFAICCTPTYLLMSMTGGAYSGKKPISRCSHMSKHAYTICMNSAHIVSVSAAMVACTCMCLHMWVHVMLVSVCACV